MYPPSNNNCNCSSILSSLICQNIPASPCMQYEHELFFQSYHHDDQYNYLEQQQQVPLLEDLSVPILADSCTETVAKPSSCTDNVIITSNHVLEGIEEGGGEGCRGNKGEDMMSSRISIIRGRISKNNKRSSNKDRHSKINTARGPRDRRMRLSLDAASKFFRLQDLLGFDKASKTVEWLLTKSDSAIEELTAKVNEGAQLPSSCSTTTTTGIGAICASNSISESYEVISGTDETSSNDKNKETAKDEKKKKKKQKKKANTARRAAFELLTRESRNQARARARERTKTKNMSQIGKSNAPANDLNPSGSRRPINKTWEESGTHEQLNFHQANNVDECNFVVSGNWNPLSIFSYQEQNAGISNEHQLVRDFQFYGKMWEG